MESADVHDADLEVKLTVEHKNDCYHLQFVVNGTVTLLCDRCLDELIWPIEDAQYALTVEYGEDYNDESDSVLVIPQSDNTLNIAYMLYDTIVLQIPMKHVHPQGKCNRAMSALLKKHRATTPGDPDAELEEELIDGIDDSAADSETETDPRWDALKNLKENN